MYHVRCNKCGAEWFNPGTYEPDVNATVLDDSVFKCNCEDVEVVDAEFPLGGE